MADLTGRTAIVTGGAGQLGMAFCAALASSGADVVVADLQGAAEAAASLRSEGGSAIGLEVDVTDRQATESMARAAVEEFDRIDVLVNNAAFFRTVTPSPFAAITEDEWDRAMAVNVKGAWNCARAVVGHMRQAGYGRIINVSSNTVWKGVPGFLHYVTSKSAIVGFTRALARELGPEGITVNTLAPDFIPDADLEERYPGHDAAVVAQRSIPRTQTPNDLVGALLFLAGPQSAFTTGQSLLVNGGSILQ